MDAARRAAHVFRTPADISRHGTDGTTPWDINTAVESAILTSPVRICGSTTGSQRRTGNQDIISPRGPISPQWSRDADPLDASINGFPAKHRYPTPIFIKEIGRKCIDESSADVNSHCRINFSSDAVFTKIPNFVNMWLASVHTRDEHGSVFVPTTRIGTPTNGYNWLPTRYIIGKVTADRVNRTGSELDYNAKNDFETRREIKILGAKIIL